MNCFCGKNVKQSDLDVALPYVHTKAEVPDPSVTTSPTAYNNFQRELRSWVNGLLGAALRDLQLDVVQYPTAESIVAELEKAVARQAKKVPTGIRLFLERQALAGFQMGAQASPHLGLPSMVVTELAAKAAVEKVLKEQLLRLSNQGVISTQGTLKQLLGDSLQQGLSPGELTRQVQGWALQRGDESRAIKWRAETIARTEASRSLNMGQRVAWQEMGVTRMKWLVAPNPCEFCKAMGKIGSQGINQPFLTVGSTLKGDKGGLMNVDYATVNEPPLHPNCRCTMVPIVSNR